MFNKVKILIKQSDFNFQKDSYFDLLFFMQMGDGRTAVNEPLVMKTHEENTCIPHSSIISISKETAQSLMDELWNAGLRPSEQQYTSETFASMKSHIDDFRKLVFKYAGIK